MHIEISTRHGQLDPSQQQYVRRKAEKLLRYFNRLMEIEVAVDHQKNSWDVEVLVSAEHKHDFVGRGSAPALEQAADAAVHKVEQQVRRYKDRIQDHHGEVPQGGTSPTRPDLPEPPESPFAPPEPPGAG